MTLEAIARRDTFIEQLEDVRRFGYREHFFILNTYTNPESARHSIEERLLLDPEHPEQEIHLIATKGMGRTLHRFDNPLSARAYILSYMITRPEDQHLVEQGSDTTTFCNAVATLGFTHDFSYGVDYIKHHSNGSSTHIRELIEPTKHAEERIHIALYHSTNGVHNKVCEETFYDHTRALEHIERLMEDNHA